MSYNIALYEIRSQDIKDQKQKMKQLPNKIEIITKRVQTILSNLESLTLHLLFHFKCANSLQLIH